MNQPNKKNTALFIAFGLSFVIGLVFLIMPFVSQKPDGLEKVSENTVGFLKKEDFKPSVKAPMPDYTLPGLKNKFDTKRYAGVIGVVVVFGITVIVGYMLRRRRNKLQ